MTKICVPIVANDIPTANDQMQQAAEAGAEVLELWLGELVQPNLTFLVALIKNSPLPILVNCKDSSEQGHFIGSPQEKLRLLRTAAEAGAAYVDVDYQYQYIKELKTSLAELSTKLILSAHFWQATPALVELEKIVALMHKKNADIIKIAAMPTRHSDVLTMINLAGILTEILAEHICLSMGELGSITRRESEFLNNELTFATMGETTAPGQMTLTQMRQILGK